MAKEMTTWHRNSQSAAPIDIVDGSDVKVSHSSESFRFLDGICSAEPEVRKQAMLSICKTLDGWFEGYGSPPAGICRADKAALKQLIVEQLPDILRLSIDCPFADVRDTFTAILQDLKERGMNVPVVRNEFASSFIPDIKTGFVYEDHEANEMLIEAFLQNNRLEHVFQIMAYHPKYLGQFLRAHHHYLYGDGPLPFSDRHYVAIMAAARHGCSYLVHIHAKQFLLQHGDEQWLKGLSFASEKLQKLSEINKILAHQPWLIGKNHIQVLRNASWSVSEIQQAIALLAHFHALTSFIYGCGVNAEVDQATLGHSFGDHISSSDVDGFNTSLSIQSPMDDLSIDELMHKMQMCQKSAETGNGIAIDSTQTERVGKSAAAAAAAAGDAALATCQCLLYIESSNCSRFIDDPRYMYKDCSRREENNGIAGLIPADFSWEIHGYALANRLCIDVAVILDEKFSIAQNLTYHTMGDLTDVDTSSFRRAIWNYVHCLYDIRHDDYDYSVVSQHLERSLQAYIKTVACFPERVSKEDYDSCMPNFRHSEKVHVNLIVLEAKLQAELLYGLRAVYAQSQVS